MKKIYSAALALLLSFYGCSAAPEISEFEGVITERSGSSVTVESTGGDIAEGNLVSFSAANLADNGAGVGDSVSVAFDGEIRKTYPLGVTAVSWDILPQSAAGAVSVFVSAVTPEGCKITFTNNRNTSCAFFGYGIERQNAAGEWELLGSKYFSTLLQEAKKAYDYIFIDTPPLGPVIDAAVIAPQCDGTIIVLGSSKIRIRQAQNVLEQLKKSECRVLGVVRNQSDAHGKGYYRNAPYYKGYYK